MPDFLRSFTRREAACQKQDILSIRFSQPYIFSRRPFWVLKFPFGRKCLKTSLKGAVFKHRADEWEVF